MTSSNLNKIVRTNVQLNSRILSKNTTEMVNNCVEKLYKQKSLKFRNELLHIRPKVFNESPLERYKTTQYQRTNKIITPEMNISETQIVSNLLNIKCKAPALTPCRILKTKHYCSSASSTSANILPSKDIEQYKKRYFHRVIVANVPNQISESAQIHQSKQHQKNMKVNYEILERAKKISGSIQEDLMAIDKILKSQLKIKDKEKPVQSLKPSTVARNLIPPIDIKKLKEKYNNKQLNLTKPMLASKYNFQNLVKERISSKSSNDKTPIETLKQGNIKGTFDNKNKGYLRKVLPFSENPNSIKGKSFRSKQVNKSSRIPPPATRSITKSIHHN